MPTLGRPSTSAGSCSALARTSPGRKLISELDQCAIMSQLAFARGLTESWVTLLLTTRAKLRVANGANGSPAVNGLLWC